MPTISNSSWLRTRFAMKAPSGPASTPPISSPTVAVVKASMPSAAMNVAEMVTVANQVGSQSFRFIEPITIAGLIFLAASYPTSVLMRKLENRLAH